MGCGGMAKTAMHTACSREVVAGWQKLPLMRKVPPDQPASLLSSQVPPLSVRLFCLVACFVACRSRYARKSSQVQAHAVPLPWKVGSVMPSLMRPLIKLRCPSHAFLWVGVSPSASCLSLSDALSLVVAMAEEDAPGGCAPGKHAGWGREGKASRGKAQGKVKAFFPPKAHVNV